MTKLIRILIVILFSCLFLFPQKTFFKKSKKSLIGYLPYWEYKLDLKKINLLSDLIFFSATIKKDSCLKIPEGLILKLELLKEYQYENKNFFLCIGGWGRSNNFNFISSNKKRRKKFISNINKFLKKYNLSGVDYDWEHPQNKTEEENYNKLIQETQQAGILVTVASAGTQKFSKKTFQSLYRVNLMSYDSGKKHSTFETAKKDINNYLKMGCPPEKIALGVPFYGRHISYRHRTKAFKKLSSKITNGKINEIDGYFFNNVDILRQKANLVKNKNLGGLMIWQIEQDSEDMRLLKSLSESLQEKI